MISAQLHIFFNNGFFIDWAPLLRYTYEEKEDSDTKREHNRKNAGSDLIAVKVKGVSRSRRVGWYDRGWRG